MHKHKHVYTEAKKYPKDAKSNFSINKTCRNFGSTGNNNMSFFWVRRELKCNTISSVVHDARDELGNKVILDGRRFQTRVSILISFIYLLLRLWWIPDG